MRNEVSFAQARCGTRKVEFGRFDINDEQVHEERVLPPKTFKNGLACAASLAALRNFCLDDARE